MFKVPFKEVDSRARVNHARNMKLFNHKSWEAILIYHSTCSQTLQYYEHTTND
jgi:hypothetical protein